MANTTISTYTAYTAYTKRDTSNVDTSTKVTNTKVTNSVTESRTKAPTSGSYVRHAAKLRERKLYLKTGYIIFSKENSNTFHIYGTASENEVNQLFPELYTYLTFSRDYLFLPVFEGRISKRTSENFRVLGLKCNENTCTKLPTLAPTLAPKENNNAANATKKKKLSIQEIIQKRAASGYYPYNPPCKDCICPRKVKLGYAFCPYLDKTNAKSI